MEMREIVKIIEENGLQLHGDIEHFVYLIEEYVREECAKICDRVEDELQNDDQVSAAGGAWRCGFEIRERGGDG
jgi:hypothetical protein